MVGEKSQLDGPRAWVDWRAFTGCQSDYCFFLPDNQNLRVFFSVAEELNGTGRAPRWLVEDLGEIAQMRLVPPSKVGCQTNWQE
ncbi:MAG: hypothetical protein IPH64_09660 [Comamonadaceae bacterium]|nr:hypothetical protein [Comamonadaceae bacterium]